MAGKLDQSLDDILKTRRQSTRRPGRRVPNAAKAATTATIAPVGGVKKATKAAKPTGKATIPTGPASGFGESKIIVSNLVSRPDHYT